MKRVTQAACAAALVSFASARTGRAQEQPPPPPAPPPGTAPPAAPPPSDAPVATGNPGGAPQTSPPWTPPGDSEAGGQGNLHDSPLFDPSGEVRHFTLTWNPLTLMVNRAEFALEIMLTDHHVIQVTGFYGVTRTNEVYSAACQAQGSAHACAETTLFNGWGGEIGYRWYSGLAGARGFYVAPSFLLGRYNATPAVGAGTSAEVDGAEIPFWNLGGALDIGWQAIVADRFVAGIGGGAQYTVPTHTFPTQELPASVYANRGLRPRALITLGVAF